MVNEFMREVFNSKTEVVEDEKLICLPQPIEPTLLVNPKLETKTKTRWEKFAQRKGITKQRKPGMVYNEELKEFLPRHGAHSAKNNALLNWCAEAKGDEDPFEDRKQKRKHNIEKNTKSRVRNTKQKSKGNRS
jgi:regulator of ribosome biosynthesis